MTCDAAVSVRLNLKLAEEAAPSPLASAAQREFRRASAGRAVRPPSWRSVTCGGDELCSSSSGDGERFSGQELTRWQSVHLTATEEGPLDLQRTSSAIDHESSAYIAETSRPPPAQQTFSCVAQAVSLHKDGSKRTLEG